MLNTSPLPNPEPSPSLKLPKPKSFSISFPTFFKSFDNLFPLFSIKRLSGATVISTSGFPLKILLIAVFISNSKKY